MKEKSAFGPRQGVKVLELGHAMARAGLWNDPRKNEIMEGWKIGWMMIAENNIRHTQIRLKSPSGIPRPKIRRQSNRPIFHPSTLPFFHSPACYA
jgi:hypothetical protein